MSDEMPAEYHALSRNEQTAFVAWFGGAFASVTKYGIRDHVSFGKAECEWVDFEDFWLKKMPELGWFNVEEKRRFIAKGMVGQPDAVTYHFSPTEKGRAVIDAYWAWVNRRIDEQLA